MAEKVLMITDTVSEALNIDLLMNKKERKLAIKSALSHKYQDKELVVVDNLNLETLKTKGVKDLIANLKLAGKVLFVTKDENENLYMGV